MKNLLYLIFITILLTLTQSGVLDNRMAIYLKSANFNIKNKQGEEEIVAITGFSFIEFQNRYDPSYVDHYTLSFYKSILNDNDRTNTESVFNKLNIIKLSFLVDNTMNVHFSINDVIEISYKDIDNTTAFEFKVNNTRDGSTYGLSILAENDIHNATSIKSLKEVIDIKKQLN